MGDQLRYATGDAARVVTVSGKDRGAILLAGKTGTAYMYMEGSGNFASSTYYMKAHPQWVQTYCRCQTAGPLLRQDLDAAAGRCCLRGRRAGQRPSPN